MSWLDGPATVKVEAVVKRYEDVDYDPSTGEILSGGNRFVFAERAYTKGTYDTENMLFSQGAYPGYPTAWNRLSTTDYNPAPFKCVRGHARAEGGSY